jgi:hypothetical protein
VDRFYFDVLIVVFFIHIGLLSLNHIVFDIVDVVIDVVKDIVLNDPSKHVELAYGRLDAFVAVEAKSDPVPPSEWIKQLFRVCF